MEFEIVGADLEDPGPKGVVARFMLASVNGDTETAIEMLTVESREGMELNVPPGERGVATIGEVVTEGELFIVPTNTEDDDGSQEMEFVVREEEGIFRIDMDACMTRAMGMSPDDFMDEMGGAIAETMGGVMEGVANAIGGAFDDDKDKPVDPPGLPGKIWTLSEHGFDPQDIMDIASHLSLQLDESFDPSSEEMETLESTEGDTKLETTRFGDESQGFEFVRTEHDQDETVGQSSAVTAYGLPEGHEFGIVWSRLAAPESRPMVSVAVRVRAPAELVVAMGEAVSRRFEVLSTVDF